MRLALGSSTAGVVLLVIKQGMRPVAAGMALGLLCSIGAARLLAADFYGLKNDSSFIFILAPLLLGAVAIAACYLPAWRASRIDPLQALRSE